MPFFSKIGLVAGGLACLAALPAHGQEVRPPSAEEAPASGAPPPAAPVSPEGLQQRQRDALAEAYGRAYLEQNPLTATTEAADDRPETAPETAAPRPPETDPFEALGLRVHGWTFRPSVETSLGYTDNVNSTGIGPARRGSGLWRLRPQLDFESGWSRHSLSGSVALTHEEYRRPGVQNRDAVDASLQGRMDIRRDLTLEGGFTYSRDQQSLSDPDVPATALREPKVDSLSAEASLTRRLGRYFIALFGSIDRAVHESVPAQGGGLIDNSDRDYTSFSGGLRLGYDVSERTSLFTEFSLDRTRHDREVDDNGIRRGSKGYTVSLGASLEGATLRGEGRIGFRIADPEDPSFAEIRGFVTESSLVWQATPLTSFTLRASTDFDETVLAGTSAIRRHAVGLDVNHALRRNLIFSASLGWTRSDYVGSARLIDEISASAGLEYRLSREMALRGRYEFVSSQSTIAGESYDRGTVTIGLILRR